MQSVIWNSFNRKISEKNKLIATPMHLLDRKEIL